MDHGGFSSCVASTAAGIKNEGCQSSPQNLRIILQTFVRNLFPPAAPEAGYKSVRFCFFPSGQYGEEYYSFVNGQHTTQGGTHQSAFKEHIARTIKEFYGKNRYPGGHIPCQFS